MEEKEIIRGYKGFDKNLKCRDFQYEVGKEYSTDKAVACEIGFHYCENPMDVLNFYAPCDDTGNLNRFCEVEGSGDFDKSKSDKICCTHLKVKAEIGLQGLIKAGVKFILDRVKWEDNKQSNTGYRSLATNTGDYSLATNTGDYSLATNTGYRSLAANTGDYSLAANTGDYSLASVEGKESIVIVTGKDSKAKGSLGSWIILTERGEWDGDTYPILDIKSFKVDGEVIKADTWYKLIDGKAVEVE